MLRRTLLSRGTKQLKRTPLRKISEKKAEYNATEGLELKRKDAAFYAHVWDSKPHRCYETNVALTKDNFHAHHVLFKELYPQYRWSDWNIVLITPEVHHQAHMDMKQTPKIYELYLELLEKHNTFTT